MTTITLPRAELGARLRCPACQGNDVDAPCAYPSEGMPGCWRDKRLAKERMTTERAAYFIERFKREEKLLGPNEQAALDFVLARLSQPERQEQKPEPKSATGKECLQVARQIVAEQAEDEGLWFVAQYVTEAHLQQELRRLHAAIENERQEQKAEPIYAYEWDTYYQGIRRSFSPSPWNGRGPDRTLTLYAAPQRQEEHIQQEAEPAAYREKITGLVCIPSDPHREKYPMCYEPLYLAHPPRRELSEEDVARWLDDHDLQEEADRVRAIERKVRG